MKNYYAVLWLFVSLITTNLINAQGCPEELGNQTSDTLIHFKIEANTCEYYPDSITVEGKSFDKKSCNGTNLKYELVSGTPLTYEDTFSAEMGFGTCDYLNGELRRETLSVEQISILDTMKIYPNPVTSGNTVHLDFTTVVEGQLRVFDLTGKQVITDQISQTSTKLLDISTLNNGVYLLQIAAEDSTTSRKIVIMN